jgi:hypothetical protein
MILAPWRLIDSCRVLRCYLLWMVDVNRWDEKAGLRRDAVPFTIKLAINEIVGAVDECATFTLSINLTAIMLYSRPISCAGRIPLP